MADVRKKPYVHSLITLRRKRTDFRIPIEFATCKEDKSVGKEKKSHGALGRREFLKKGAAIGVAAPALGALDARALDAQQVVWDREVDFV